MKNYIRTTTQIPAVLHDRLRMIAFSRRKSIACLIREALEAWVKKNDKKI